MGFIKEGEENIQPRIGFWQMTPVELKAIIDNYPGNFERQLESKRTHEFLKKPPTCGMSWLKDRGVLEWYLENEWVIVWKEQNDWMWALGMKYIEERIDEKESALAELISRRQYKQNEELKAVNNLA